MELFVVIMQMYILFLLHVKRNWKVPAVLSGMWSQLFLHAVSPPAASPVNAPCSITAYHRIDTSQSGCFLSSSPPPRHKNVGLLHLLINVSCIRLSLSALYSVLFGSFLHIQSVVRLEHRPSRPFNEATCDRVPSWRVGFTEFGDMSGHLEPSCS